MSKKKFIIFSPTNVATGGTELLQQLCFQINQLGSIAYMYYCQGGDFSGSIVEGKFQKIYSNPFLTKLPSDEEEKDSIYVVSETLIPKLHKIKSQNKVIWWLSVDNYIPHKHQNLYYLRLMRWHYRNAKNQKIFSQVNHFVQSFYARSYLVNTQHITERKIFFLSDYLNDDYLGISDNFLNKREDIILYNPKKGYTFTQKIIKAVPEYKFIPLENMTRNEIINLMQKAKLYIDFGNHPGKDRIPREAAICGCCVITSRNGSAAFQEDVPIPEKYKFEDTDYSIEAIHNIIINCINNYSDKHKDFDNYRAVIRSEKNKFIEDTKKLIQIYAEGD